MKFSRVRVGILTSLWECQECSALMRMGATMQHHAWHAALAEEIRRASLDRIVKHYV